METRQWFAAAIVMSGFWLPSVRAQTTTLLPASAADFDWVGHSVGLQGSFCVTGARNHDANGMINSGAAYVFERTLLGWTERAQLLATDLEAGDVFGSDVAIDGDTVLVGAEWEGDGPQQNYGAAYVFVRNGTQWMQQAKLVAPQRLHNSLFGRVVALSGDTAVVSAMQDSSVSSLAGSVDVFVRVGTTWTHQQHLSVANPGLQKASFGSSLAIEDDTLLVGAAFDDTLASNQGSVYVFERFGSAWTQHSKIYPQNPVDNLRFGADVDLDGSFAVVGTFALPGKAYVLEQSPAGWLPIATLQPNEPNATTFFGSLVDIDGLRVAVGAVAENTGSFISGGAAYLFELHGAAWTLTQRLISPTPESDDAFCIVGLSGTTLVVGEPRDGSTNIGALHVYEFGALGSECVAGTSTQGCTPHLSLDGTPSGSSSTAAYLRAHGVRTQTSGLVFVGLSAQSMPWAIGSSSVLCIAPPLVRLPPQINSGGGAGQCEGALEVDLNEYVRSNGGSLSGQSVFAGTTVRAQAWYRDPPAPRESNLADALALTFYP